MSRSKKGKKSPGYEYWSKRPNSMSSPGKISKNITHRKERADAKKVVHKAKKNVDPQAD
jgi:hypothetical protein